MPLKNQRNLHGLVGEMEKLLNDAEIRAARALLEQARVGGLETDALLATCERKMTPEEAIRILNEGGAVRLRDLPEP